jgi:hypothetical protein
VLARSVLARSVAARSILARSELARSALACSALDCSLVVLRSEIVPGAAAGSRSAVAAGQSSPRPGPDDGSAGPQRCPEPDTSIRPGDQELAVPRGAAERSGPDRCRGQDASGRGWDTLCSLPGAAGPMTASLATVPRRGARSGRSTRPHAGLDRWSASGGSCLGHTSGRELSRPSRGPPSVRPTGMLYPRTSCPTRSCSRRGRLKRSAPRTRRSGSSSGWVGLASCAISPRYRHRGPG